MTSNLREALRIPVESFNRHFKNQKRGYVFRSKRDVDIFEIRIATDVTAVPQASVGGCRSLKERRSNGSES